jgi:ABC-type oligopeptide transport system substrate-binding subunit
MRSSDIGYSGFVADYPAESGFIPPLLACDSYYNLGGFCDPDIDARMRKSARIASTNPQRSHQLWSEIEHILVDRATLVPLLNIRHVTLASQRLSNFLFSPA